MYVGARVREQENIRKGSINGSGGNGAKKARSCEPGYLRFKLFFLYS